MKILIRDIVVDETLNPRKRYGGSSEPGREGATVEEIAESMEAIGQKTPVLIERVDPKRFDGRQYRLREGFRRMRAAKSLGWTELDATVDDGKFIEEAAVATNVGRSNYTPPEMVFIVDHLTTSRSKKSLDGREGLGLDPMTAAKRIGCSANTLRRYLEIARGVDVSILKTWLRAPGAFRLEEMKFLSTRSPEAQAEWFAKRSDVEERRRQSLERNAGAGRSRAQRMRALGEAIDSGVHDRRGEEWKAGARAVIEYWETGVEIES